jgi:CDP-paratose 2-epimerase
MSVILISGSAGLIGSEAAFFFANLGFDVVGIDNDMRRVFFGNDASTQWNLNRLMAALGPRYRHIDSDIRDYETISKLFQHYGRDIKLVIHTAAQPSHDWAARDPMTDFTINANGTLNLLEATRHYAPEATFIFTSTNKVYGDTPNRLPLVELKHRWEIDSNHIYAGGIREDMSIDQTLHSLFGTSKVAADILVQEYGRYFDLNTACFRGGCLTGPNHSGAQLHGFLAYLMKCTVTGTPYTVYGYKGKQVRDNMHSADLLRAFYEFFKAPRVGEVYNIGGGRYSNCSMLEAIQMCQEIVGRELSWTYSERNRRGDHIWWVSDNSKFMNHYPDWCLRYDVPGILEEIYQANLERWRKKVTKSEEGKIEHFPHKVGACQFSPDVGPSVANPPPRHQIAQSDRSRTTPSRKCPKNILGIRVDAVDYEAVVAKIIAAAHMRKGLGVTALAVHGVMTGVLEKEHRYRLNHLDLVVPDGQPVRWALNWLHNTQLNDRVYGPTLMLKVCERAAREGLPIYLYGSSLTIIGSLSHNLQTRFPNLIIAGAQPSRFRQISIEEKQAIVDEIRNSGATITFVGLGCPRQEVWAYEYREALSMPILAVGAAFDFHAGKLPQAPPRLQRVGLEWFYRLIQEPTRLWKRYILLNPLYIALLILQATRLVKFNPLNSKPPIKEMRYG